MIIEVDESAILVNGSQIDSVDDFLHYLKEQPTVVEVSPIHIERRNRVHCYPEKGITAVEELPSGRMVTAIIHFSRDTVYPSPPREPFAGKVVLFGQEVDWNTNTRALPRALTEWLDGTWSAKSNRFHVAVDRCKKRKTKVGAIAVTFLAL